MYRYHKKEAGILLTAFAINVASLYQHPRHFSFAVIVLSISCILGLTQNKNLLKKKRFRKAFYLSLAFSCLLILLYTYWSVLGPSGCSAFFGDRISCYDTFGYYASELVFVPLILLFITYPLRGK